MSLLLFFNQFNASMLNNYVLSINFLETKKKKKKKKKTYRPQINLIQIYNKHCMIPGSSHPIKMPTGIINYLLVN